MSGGRPVARALARMPVLSELRRRLDAARPLAGARVAMVFHQTAESAALAAVVRAAGAALRVIPSKTATADPAVAAELVELGVSLDSPADEDERRRCLGRVRDDEPHLMIDNADLFRLWHGDGAEPPPPVLGATVHSRSACRIVEEHVHGGGELRYPVLAVGSTPAKLDLESRYGTGQSAVASLIRATGLQLSGKRVVVVGYGNVGRGAARFLRGLNARVVVVQSSPYRALEALLDGFDVQPLDDALGRADVVLTATGGRHVVAAGELHRLPHGAVLGNLGRDQEIDVAALTRLADAVTVVDSNLTEYRLGDATVQLLGGGHQFNHVAGSANSSEIMDLSLALHVLGLVHLWRQPPSGEPRVEPVPEFLVDEMARIKLGSMGVAVGASDPPTPSSHPLGREPGGDHAVPTTQ